MSSCDITCIIGPTGIGKSDLAIQLARDTGAEIISSDAFQVYRGMDIGTAKVSTEIRAQIPHHLIDIKNPDEPYSVAEFLARVDALISELRARNTPIILCGGTPFYSYAFVHQFEFGPDVLLKQDPRTEEAMARYSLDELWAQLTALDPKAADHIKLKDQKRVIRALDHYYKTGELPSQNRRRHTTPRSDCRIIGLTAPRPEVYRRIETRVDRMLAEGLVAEVQTLLDQGYSPYLKAFQAIGYKEVIDYLLGGVGYAEMVELVNQRSRHYAKHQLCWFKRFTHVHWSTLFE